jgi:hypothetical protein
MKHHAVTVHRPFNGNTREQMNDDDDNHNNNNNNNDNSDNAVDCKIA